MTQNYVPPKVLLVGEDTSLNRIILGKLNDVGYHTTMLSHGKKVTNKKTQEIPLKQSETLKRHLKGVSIVISSLELDVSNQSIFEKGVDYIKNVNLLQEAILSGVKKFVYITSENIVSRKEGKKLEEFDFKKKLKASSLSYSVLKIDCLFSDLHQLLGIARRGRLIVIGNKNRRLYPVRSSDVAKACISTIDTERTEINLIGTSSFTPKELIKFTFNAYQKNPKIVCLPKYANTALRVVNKGLKSIGVRTSIYLPTNSFTPGAKFHRASDSHRFVLKQQLARVFFEQRKKGLPANTGSTSTRATATKTGR